MSERQRFARLLRSCSKNMLLDQGKQTHAAAAKLGLASDLILNNDLIDLYAKCRRMDIARRVFDKMPQRNVVSWTALMCGYLHQGDAKAPLFLLVRMGCSGIRPNDYTLSINLKASGILRAVRHGMQVHVVCIKTGFEWDLVVCNSILDMYSKCGRILEACRVFHKMPDRTLVSWNAMIAGYATCGNSNEALLLFREMRSVGEIPDEFTFTSTLKACSGIGSIRKGTQIHGFMIATGFPCFTRAVVSGALIDLYVKCGDPSTAQKVFNQTEQKNVVSWSSLIQGYGQVGDLPRAMNLFRQLRENNIPMDGFVISSMMDIFADFALAEEGKQLHSLTFKVPFGLETSVANSVLDMYFKCGLLLEAKKCFILMPTRNVVSWTAMITGCGQYGLGKEAIRLFNQMQSDNIEADEVAYLALLSACSHSGLIEECQDYFSRMRTDHRIKPRIEHYACMVDLLGRAGRIKEAKKLLEDIPFEPSVGILQTLLSACMLHGELEIGREVGEALLGLDGKNLANYVMISNMYADAGLWEECESLRHEAKKKGLKKEAGHSWVGIDNKVQGEFSRS